MSEAPNPKNCTEITDSIRRAALIIATLNSFITPFMGSAVNIALPRIAKDLHVDAVLLSWVATAYILAIAVSLVPFGRLADIHGRKLIFTIGVIIFTVSSIFCAVSNAISLLLFFRVLQGIGNGMVYSTGIAVLVSVYPPRERGRVLGINVAAVYIGLSAGPFLGGVMTQYLTWRSVFLATVPLGGVILFLIFHSLKSEWADARGESFDLAGSLIYALAIVALILGIADLPGMTSLWWILLSVVGGIVFVRRQLRIRFPVFDVTLFRTNRMFAFSSLAALINYSATYAISFLMSLYLQKIRGMTPQGAGLVLVSMPVMMAAFSPAAGRISDRIAPRLIATFGMILTCIGLLLFIFVGEDASLGRIIGYLALLGLGFAFFSSPNTNAIMSSVEKRFLGIASGTTGTMRSLGMMLSMGVSTVIFAIIIGRVQITPERYPELMRSISIAFMVFTLFCFAGVFASLVRGRQAAGQGEEAPAEDCMLEKRSR